MCSRGGKGWPRQRRVPVLPREAESKCWGLLRSSEWMGRCALRPSTQGCPPAPLPLCSLGAWSSGKCELNRRFLLPWFSGGGVGVGLRANTRDPFPGSCPTELPDIHISTGSAFLTGPRCSREGSSPGAQQKASFRAQCSLQAYCSIWHSSPERERGSRRCGEGM